MNIILDTNIIIRYPEILSIEKDELKFHIPTAVVTELRNLNPELTKVLENIKNKSINLQDFLLNPSAIDSKTLAKIGIGDYSILEAAKVIKSKFDNVKFATLDLAFSDVVNSNEIETINLNELKSILNKGTLSKENEAVEEIKNYKKTERNRLIQGIVIGNSISVLAVFIYTNLESIVNTINVWGTIILILILGIGLFIFRERYRLPYGIAEFLIGFIAVVSIFYPDFNYDNISIDVIFGLKLFGSLYIMVRGQDNILKALKGTTLGETFKRTVSKDANR